MKRIFRYPTGAQVQLVVNWANLGPQVLTPHHPGERATAFLHLRGVIERTALPGEYESMRREMLAGRMDPAADRLLATLLATLRFHGYIHAYGPVRDGLGRPLYARVPLTGNQLHILRQLASGLTGPQTAAYFGKDRQRVFEALARIKADHGCATNTQAVAMVYANGWLPTFREHRQLMRSHEGPLGKAFLELTVAEAAA